MKKLKDIVREGSSTGGQSTPPDSGPNTFVKVEKYKEINQLFAEKLGMKILKWLADSDMIDIQNGSRMGNKLKMDDKFEDFNNLTNDMAKKLGMKVVQILKRDIDEAI